MRTTAFTRAFVLAFAALAAAFAGCEKRDYDYPFFEFQLDTDTELDTDSDSDTELTTDTESESETLTGDCPDDYVDGDGRCIRYVDWDAEATICGTGWDGAFQKIQDGIDSAWAAAQVLGSCEVWVASGTYRSFEDDPMDSIMLRSNVQVYGGFAGVEQLLEERDVAANETILDGRDASGAQASYHVVMGAEHGVLDGFTVTGGDAEGSSPHHRGGGLYSNSARTTIRNCIFRGNRAIEGGALFLYDSEPVVERCLFEENSADLGGAVFILNGTAFFKDVRIEDNAAWSHGGGIYFQSVFGDCEPSLEAVAIVDNRANLDGGGAYIENCSPQMTSAKLERNEALRDGGGLFGFHGAAYLTESSIRANSAHGDGGGAGSFDSALNLVDSQVLENRADGDGGGLRTTWSESFVESTLIAANTAGADGGGVYVDIDTPRFVESLITGNRAARGGGAFNGERGASTFLNTVLHGNRASALGDGLYNAAQSEVDVVNTIAYGNGTTEIFDEKESDTEVHFCDVRGGYTGILNLDADPLFTAPGAWDDAETPDEPSDDVWTNGDYHLLPGSPCVDRADETASPTQDADDKDWEDTADAGLPDTSVDIGAYDCQG
jgi:hypothetical protein